MDDGGVTTLAILDPILSPNPPCYPFPPARDFEGRPSGYLTVSSPAPFRQKAVYNLRIYEIWGVALTLHSLNGFTSADSLTHSRLADRVLSSSSRAGRWAA